MFIAKGLTGAAGAWAFVALLRQLYYIFQPSEVLIFAGLRRRTGSGQQVGYRTVRGGSALRIPVLEEVMRLDLSNMIIDLRVDNAYSKGGIPLNVSGVANIKISGDEPGIHNAIERLIGKNQDEIRHIAKETLEGNLRGVMASLTPEQLNEDKVTFAKTLLEEAEDDLQKLGLVLDTLQIQNISDDVRYLDSIGRKQLVELKRDSRIAEAEAKSQSAVKQAENERITAFDAWTRSWPSPPQKRISASRMPSPVVMPWWRKSRPRWAPSWPAPKPRSCSRGTDQAGDGTAPGRCDRPG